MNANEISLGDTLEVLKTTNAAIPIGSFGLVVDLDNLPYIGLEFENFYDGHDCRGKGKDDHCWNIASDTLRKPIIIKEIKEI